MRGEHFTIQLLWAAARLLVTRSLPCLPSGWVLLQGNEDVGSVQDLTFLNLCLMWIRKIRTQEKFKIPLCNPLVVETFSSDRVTFRIPSNINDGAPLRKQSTTLTRRLFLQKSSTTDLRPDSKCGSDSRCYECGELVNWKCMEFLAASWCTKLSFDQTIKIRLLVMLIASAKPQSARGAFHQPAFMGSCLTISQM